MLLVGSAAHAACVGSNIQVTNQNDSGPGSLRQAIADVSNDCTISFAPGTYNIQAASRFEINFFSPNKNLNIDATGATVTVRGTTNTASPNFSLFNITFGNTVSMKNFTIADSGGAPWWDGGGIINNGTLTLDGMTLSNHSLFFSGSGGGMVNMGTATVRNSAFINNQALSGGGIANLTGATLTVINTTFYGNVANDANGRGGAIYNQSGTVSLFNTTIVGNRAVSAGGGVFNANGNSLGITNTLLVANETGASGSTTADQNCSGTITDSGHNLDSANTCALTSTGSLASNTSALTGSLGNYGGLSQTIPLLPGSAAIDAGDAASCAAAGSANGLDQRGIVRPQGSVCDIGAFESQGFALATIAGSTPQSTAPGSAFTNALGVTVTSLASGIAEPVNGGRISFTAGNAGTASASLSGGGSATITSGSASLNATANANAGGPYNVTANARGVASSVSFALTNSAGVPAPTVTGVSPGVGPTAGGTLITITGTNFVGITQVTIGGVPCTGVSVQSPTSLTCTTAAGTTGGVSVVVSNAAGSSNSNTQYGYTNTAPVGLTEPVPTLSEWTMLLLASLLALTGLRFTSRR